MCICAFTCDSVCVSRIRGCLKAIDLESVRVLVRFNVYSPQAYG